MATWKQDQIGERVNARSESRVWREGRADLGLWSSMEMGTWGAGQLGHIW